MQADEGKFRCYCGNTLAHESVSLPDNYCTWSCMGDIQQICGGKNTLSLYEVGHFEAAALD